MKDEYPEFDDRRYGCDDGCAGVILAFMAFMVIVVAAYILQ